MAIIPCGIISSSSAFGFLLLASSHAKPLRGGLTPLNRNAISRTLQQAQSPGLNCYFCTKLKRKRHRPLTASPSFSQQSDCRNCRAPLPGILCLKFMNKQPAPQFRLKPGRLWRHKQPLVRYPVQFFNRRRVHGESRLTVCMYPPLQL